MGRFANSWALTKESIAVLRSDSKLMVFPIISGVASTLVLASFAVPVVLMVVNNPDAFRKDNVSSFPSALFLLFSFLFYFISFFIATYCNVALVGCAMDRFEGRPVSVGRGLQIANSRIGQIAAWALVAATVGMILKALEQRAGWIGRLIINFVGLAWAIATFFVVPVLAVEGVGPFTAIKRSTGIIRQKWGEALIVNAGIGIVMGITIVLAVLVTAACVVGAAMATQGPVLPIIVGVLGLLAVVFLALVGATLKEIVNAALYRFATTGQVTPGFSSQSLGGVFGRKS